MGRFNEKRHFVVFLKNIQEKFRRRTIDERDKMIPGERNCARENWENFKAGEKIERKLQEPERIDKKELKARTLWVK